MQETPETRAKLANAINQLRSQGREAEVNSLVGAYKAKYTNQPVQPVAPVEQAPKVNPFIAAGEGAGLSVGNLMTGVAGGVAKLVGADNVAKNIENIRQKAFVLPTKQSQQTLAGKAGKTVTDIASYLTPGGLPANIAKDTLVGFGQSQGDVKAGLASGLITGLSGGLSKIPGVNTAGKNLVRKGVKAVQTLAPGYSSDVVSGLAGMRGEDRTGGKAFIPGVGTALVGGIAGIPLAKKALSNVADNTSSYLYRKAITPNVKDAEKIFRNKVNTPLSKKVENALTYGQNITESNPITRAEVARKYNLIGTGTGIGVRAKRTANNIYSTQIEPVVNQMAKDGVGKLKTNELFEFAEDAITKTTDPKRQENLQDALDYLKEKYVAKFGEEVGVDVQQALKRDLAKFTPQAIFKGKDVASEVKTIEDLINKKIRNNTYNAIPEARLKEKYLDYGQLTELEGLALKDIQDSAIKGGSGTLVGGIYHTLADPVFTTGGLALKGVSRALGNYSKNNSRISSTIPPNNLQSRDKTINPTTIPNNIDIPTTIPPTGNKSIPLKQGAYVKPKPNSQSGKISIGADEEYDIVAKALVDYDTTPLMVNGKLDLSKSDIEFDIEQLQKKINKRAFTPNEIAKTRKILEERGALAKINKQSGFISTGGDNKIYQEARKFKSAEEFVKDSTELTYKNLQENPYSIKAYGKDFNEPVEYYRAGDIKKNGDIWLTDNEAGAKQYSNAGGGTKVGSYIVQSKKPLIIDTAGGKYAKGNVDINKILTKDEIRNGYTNNPDTKQKFIQYAKDNGYDSVQFADSFPDGEGGMRSLVVFDKSKIKTKSQLEQIWKEANAKTSTKKGMTAINPLTVGAGVSALGAGGMYLNNKDKK